MTDKRFCPKCKGGLHEHSCIICMLDKAPCQWEYPGLPQRYRYCMQCHRPFFEMDCLTEEQLLIGYKKDLIESNKNLISNHISKQSPPFCFDESHQSKQSETQNDLSLTDETQFANDTNVVIKTTEINDAVEWINIADQQPQYKESNESNNLVLVCQCENPFTESRCAHDPTKKYKHDHDCKLIQWCVACQKPAQALNKEHVDDKDDVEIQAVTDCDWINFSDRKPEVGQIVKILGKEGLFKHRGCGYFTNLNAVKDRMDEQWTTKFDVEIKWKPAQADKDAAHPTVKENITTEHVHKNPDSYTCSDDMVTKHKECEHDLELEKGPSCDLRKVVKTEREKQIAMIALQKGYDDFRAGILKGQIKDPFEDIKSQSQVAIDKVIEALDKIGLIPPKNDAALAANNYFYAFRERLKELNK